MNSTPVPTAMPGDPHWIEIVDSLAQCPPWQLGPFAGAREAQRMARGVLRLVNAARFTVTVRGDHTVTRTNDSSGCTASSLDAKCQNAA